MHRSESGLRGGYRGLVRWLPAVLLVLGVAIDLVSSAHITFTPLFVAVPLVAAPLRTFRVTAAYGVAATVAVTLLILFWDRPGRAEGLMTVTTTALISVLALVLNRTVTRRREEAASARSTAEAVQRAVVPALPARAGPLRVAARYEAAEVDVLVGGDFHAVLDTPYGPRMLIGDVRGKGLQSIEEVVLLLGVFREAADTEARLERIAARLDAALSRQKRSRDGPARLEGFATAVLAEVPADAPGELRLVNRGHPAPLLLRPDGSVRSLEPTDFALPLGLTGLGTELDRPDTEPFPAGAHLVLYTDGVSETRDARGEFYDPARGLRGRHFAAPEQLVEHLIADVSAYSGGGVHDDMVIMAVQRPPEDPEDTEPGSARAGREPVSAPHPLEDDRG
ncbi:PP2C family protein-serine/threonine phosphatase [Streptomyces sp. ACA25]|uniref:PP2C family protein-serine/threonine phosphatase n=1 Tax=Streptomyces sp. ACA25 TaxID=3022596 RepID=UPI002307CB41|nr:PP2C family protein-serine/threonine phosphatase [Streptomyces sp. ACA25]MDB1090194.1 PP2C family protein-serine/threonine phosphatase [Streptomyces sp. ACA25]